MDKEGTLRIRKGDVIIQVFDEVSVDELVDTWKNDEPQPFRYAIQIIRRNQVIARYRRSFATKPSLTHLNNFLKKFLRDPTYRAQFQVGDADWNKIIQWDEPVNPQTKETIRRLNDTHMNKLRFKDFMRLKVGGYDAYSRMKIAKLDTLIPQEDKALIKKELIDPDLIIQAKRWVARGLQVQKSIRKVKTDQIIRENAS